MRGPLKIKRVDKLIAINVLGSLAVVWLVLVGFDAFTSFARQLGDLGEHGYTVAQAALYVAMTIPRRVYEMFSHAALIGSLMGLGGLAASSELTALRAAGMSRLRVAGSAVLAVAVLTLAVVVLGETAGPAGEQRAQALQASLRSNKIGLTTRSGLWARDGDTIINAKSALAEPRDGRLQVVLGDVRVFEFDSAGVLTSFIRAGTAVHIHGVWQLDKVRQTRFDDSGAHSNQRDTMPWQTRLDPQLLELSVINPRYMSLRDLHRNIRYFRANGQNPGAYAEAWWARVFYPFNVLILVLAALPFAFAALRSGGLGKRVFIGIVLAVCWYFLQLALVSLGTVYGLPPWLANLLPVLVLLLVVGVYYRRVA